MLLVSVCVSCGTAYYYGYDLHRAASEDKPHKIEQLIDGGANLEATDSHGRTPLIWAIEAGRIKNVEILIKKDARIK